MVSLLSAIIMNMNRGDNHGENHGDPSGISLTNDPIPETDDRGSEALPFRIGSSHGDSAGDEQATTAEDTMRGIRRSDVLCGRTKAAYNHRE